MADTRRYEQHLERLRREMQHKRRERETLEEDTGPTSRRIPSQSSSAVPSAVSSRTFAAALSDEDDSSSSKSLTQRWDQTATVMYSDSDDSSPRIIVNNFGRSTRRLNPMTSQTPSSVSGKPDAVRQSMRGGVPLLFDDPQLSAAYDAAARRPGARAGKLGHTDVQPPLNCHSDHSGRSEASGNGRRTRLTEAQLDQPATLYGMPDLGGNGIDQDMPFPKGRSTEGKVSSTRRYLNL